MSFRIGNRDSVRMVQLKLLYLVPCSLVLLPYVLVMHGVLGLIEAVREFPGAVRNELYQARKREQWAAERKATA